MDRSTFGKMMEKARKVSGLSVQQMADNMQTTFDRVRDIELNRRDTGMGKCMKYLENTLYEIVVVKEGRVHPLPNYKALVSWMHRRSWSGTTAKFAKRLGLDRTNLGKFMNYQKGMFLSTFLMITEKLGSEVQLIQRHKDGRRKTHADKQS